MLSRCTIAQVLATRAACRASVDAVTTCTTRQGSFRSLLLSERKDSSAEDCARLDAAATSPQRSLSVFTSASCLATPFRLESTSAEPPAARRNLTIAPVDSSTGALEDPLFGLRPAAAPQRVGSATQVCVLHSLIACCGGAGWDFDGTAPRERPQCVLSIGALTTAG